MRSRSAKGEQTRRRVLDAALDLFREKGFEATTMRDIAAAAGMSLGAAYHYFDSKDALLLAYYEGMQSEHERRVAEGASPDAELRDRLDLAFRSKLAMLEGDRRLLAALFRELGDPSRRLSVFSPETRGLRDASIGLFTEPFRRGGLPGELVDLLGPAAWLAHLAVFLFFVHDSSEGARRTHALVDAVLELFAGAASWLTHPLAAPARRRVLAAARRIGFPPAPGGEG